MNRDRGIMCVPVAEATTPEPARLHGDTGAGKRGTALFTFSPLSSSAVRHPGWIMCVTQALADAN